MEVCMSLNALVRLPLSSNSRPQEDALIIRHSLVSARPSHSPTHHQRPPPPHHLMVVQAKGKKGMAARTQFKRQPPPLPKIEDDGNPKFVIFIRMANVYLWYPLSIITGGTTAKIMVAAKDNFLGKYIYKDTLARNLAAVIYRDEKQIQTTAFKQYRVLRSASEFRYGYKLVEHTNLRAALSTTDVIELPTQDQLKTVLDKVKDFFGDAKESFGKITSLEIYEYSCWVLSSYHSQVKKAFRNTNFMFSLSSCLAHFLEPFSGKKKDPMMLGVFTSTCASQLQSIPIQFPSTSRRLPITSLTPRTFAYSLQNPQTLETPRKSGKFICYADNGNGLTTDPDDKEKNDKKNGLGIGGEEKSEKSDGGPRLNLRWFDLVVDPDPDNILAVGLTGVLAWASIQILGQLFFISLAILVAALKYSFIAALLIFILITLL